jgi:hypothetical protein
MRAIIRRFDGLIRRLSGVYEFSDRPGCLLRLQLSQAPHDLRLPGGVVSAGSPVLLLHVWNEHVPPIPRSGPDVAWALAITRMLVRSFRDVADEILRDPRLQRVQAVGGWTSLASLPGQDGGGGLIRRLGFAISPYAGPLGRFGEFWETFYTWWIMWTFNPASLRGRRLVDLRHDEMWMTVDEFVRRYASATPPSAQTGYAATPAAQTPTGWRTHC